MSHYDIFVLSSNLCLDLPTRRSLIVAAVSMLEGRHVKRKVSGPHFEGEVTTTFGRAAIGSIAGTIFEANLETISGKRDVRYIIRDDNREAAERVLKGGIRWHPHHHDGRPHPGENAPFN